MTLTLSELRERARLAEELKSAPAQLAEAEAQAQAQQDRLQADLEARQLAAAEAQAAYQQALAEYQASLRDLQARTAAAGAIQAKLGQAVARLVNAVDGLTVTAAQAGAGWWPPGAPVDRDSAAGEWFAQRGLTRRHLIQPPAGVSGDLVAAVDAAARPK